MSKNEEIKMLIRIAEKKDSPIIAMLAQKMWDHGADELSEEFESLIGSRDAAVFVAEEKETLIAFAQCQLRHDYVEGTDSSPVGYLEGIFVEEAFRHQGVASRLLSACEQWAREKGCKEFASDCELSNTDGLRFHLALGFSEANRVICFTKAL